MPSEPKQICYNSYRYTKDSEPPKERIVEAKVLDFGHRDDGSIEVTFEGEPFDGVNMCVYTIRFEGIDGYAMAAAIPADNGVEVEDVDYEAEAEEAADSYESSFSENEIALPKGTYVNNGELYVTDAAPQIVQEVLVESGIAEESVSRAITPGEGDVGEAGVEAEPFDGGGKREDDGGVTPGNGDAGNPGIEAVGFEDGNGGNRPEAAQDDTADDSATVDGPGDATLEYIKQYNERQKVFANYDAVARYAPEILGEINPTAGKVAALGSDTYRICKGLMYNNWGSTIEGSLGVLKMFGLFKGKGQTGVTNEKILSEVQKVGLEVSDMHSLTREMNRISNLTLSELYAQGIKNFNTALIALNSNAEIVQRMFTQGALLAAARGIHVPAEDATAEEEFEFNYQLVQLIRGELAKGGWDAAPFDGFDVYMNNVISEFIHVAGDVSQSAEFNPVICYDKYWNMYFNFDTQGYYLRQSFRSGIEFELKRAFGLIEIYHNIFSPKTRGVYADTYNKLFISAIEQLNSMPAGTSPEEVSGGGMRYFDYLKPVHCNTFNKDIRSMTWGCCAIGNYVPTGMIEEYQRRLHGRTVDEDLKLAGMISTKYQNYNSSYTAVGFNGRKEGKQYFADVIKQNGKIIYKDYISSYGKENKREFINYYYHWFIFAGDPNQQYYWP